MYTNHKVVAGRVEFQGPVTFHSNNAIGFDGGAIYLLSFSQLFLQNNTQLEFVNNTGRYLHMHKYTHAVTNQEWNETK